VFQPLLEVNLGTGSIQSFELPHEVRGRWIGGTGLGLYLLSREIEAGLLTTDPDCPVFVLTGALTGTSVPHQHTRAF
jgi:aldehyde:ferredoxin oxidoreductase